MPPKKPCRSTSMTSAPSLAAATAAHTPQDHSHTPTHRPHERLVFVPLAQPQINPLNSLSFPLSIPDSVAYAMPDTVVSTLPSLIPYTINEPRNRADECWLSHLHSQHCVELRMLLTSSTASSAAAFTDMVPLSGMPYVGDSWTRATASSATAAPTLAE